jgi:hypothetical protein
MRPPPVFRPRMIGSCLNSDDYLATQDSKARSVEFASGMASLVKYPDDVANNVRCVRNAGE